MTEPSQNTSNTSPFNIDLGRRDRVKRVAFLLVWLLLLFGDKLAAIGEARLPEQFRALPPILGNPRVLWLMALVTVVVAARGNPFAIVFQAAYFLLFIPIALGFVIYKTTNAVLRFPRTTHQFVTSPRLHAILWPLTALCVLGVFADWVPQLQFAYLAVVLFAISTSIALAFILAFSPGTLHRNLVRLAIGTWSATKRDADKKLESGAFARDPAKRAAKIKEIENLRDQGENLIAYLAKSSAPQTAVKIFVIFLAGLMPTLVFLFAVSFKAVEQISLGSFMSSDAIRFVDLLFYSLSNMVGAEPLGPVALSDLAKFVAALQLICSAAIVIVLILVLTTVSPDRYAQELQAIIAELQHAHDEAQETITSLSS